jgi:hypothetical protein
MRVLGVLSVLLPMLLGLMGCSRGLETRTYEARVIRGASPDDVLLAAELVLRREFGRLEKGPAARRIVSRPVEFQTSSESGTARDLYGGRSTMRRIAHFAVARRDDGSIARLRIEVERKDTARREAFQPESGRISDAPSQTPIERDAATTTRQNTVWTFVKRDRRLERALLWELQDQFTPEPEETPAAQPDADRSAETP